MECAPQGVRINAVTPGLIASERMPPFPNLEDLKSRTLERTPAGRLGTPEDVATAVRFLLMDASWIVGQCLTVDGGCSLV